MSDNRKENAEERIEGLLLPVQEIVENKGVIDFDLQKASKTEPVKEGLRLDFLKQIDAKLNKVLKVLNVEVKEDGQANN